MNNGRIARLLIGALLLILLAGCRSSGQDPAAAGTEAGAGIAGNVLGVAYSPARFPNSTFQDIGDFFHQAKSVGKHVSMIADWAALPYINDIKAVQKLTKSNGMLFHLEISPIAQYGGRKKPGIPTTVPGKSFSDAAVREAFKKQALEYASLHPDYLGLGTEVNLLAQNPEEFKAYLTLTRETYALIKQKYPQQNITISFQWDVLLTQKQFDVLGLFKDSLDVYSFTTYPDFFGKADDLPPDYYASVRKLLPTQRLGFSEVGWSSGNGGSEDEQANYYKRMRLLMQEANPEYVVLALLHDVNVFNGELSRLNFVGIRHADGTPKKSWSVMAGHN